MGLSQLNGVKNCKGGILDLCFSNIESVYVVESGSPVVPTDKYHPALEVDVTFTTPVDRRPIAGHTHFGKQHNFAAGDYVGLYSHVFHFDWSPILESNDVNYQVSQFTKVVQDGLDHYIR